MLILKYIKYMAEILQHRNYFQVAEGNLEFIRGDIWDINLPDSAWPLAVYNPGIDLIKKRLKQISITMNNGTGEITKSIFNQFEIRQNAGRDAQTADTTWSFIDKEDQAITFMLNDWLNMIGDPVTGFGRHKKELMFSNMQINVYNTLLQKIRYYDLWCGTMKNPDINDQLGERPADLSDVSMSIFWEMAIRKII